MKKKFFLIIVLIAIISFSFFANIAQANILENIQAELEPIGEVYGENGTPRDVRSVIMDVVQYALDFLGVIFILLIIYGGFLWMTAGGNDENVQKAKKIIIRSSIGLAIVLVSLAITYFIFEVLLSATYGEYYNPYWD